MVRTDHGIKKDIGPESQYAQTVRINWFIQLLRKKVIQKTKVRKHKPKSYCLVHIVTLQNSLSNAVLTKRQISYERNYQNKNKGTDDKPIGDVNFFCRSIGNSFNNIIYGKCQAASPNSHDRPSKFFVFASAVIYP